MLWARGMIEGPDYNPRVGVDSLHTRGLLDEGWPTRIGPSYRIAIGVKATCKDVRVQKYAVAIVVGQWKEGSWQVVGTCTWLVLQAFLGRHQVNIPNRSGWQALQNGAKSVLVADMWHNLNVNEWSRLRALHVPPKLLKSDQGDQRAWLQRQEAQLCAPQRAEQEAPVALVQTLQCNDEWHRQVYEVASERMGAILQDKDHYMHDKIASVDTEYKVKVKAPKGRIEVMQQLTQRVGGDGQHQWMLKGGGVQCKACGMNIKACSTHAEIVKKDGSLCAGIRSHTLTQQMQQLVDESAQLPEEASGHRWELRSSALSAACGAGRKCLVVAARKHSGF